MTFCTLRRLGAALLVAGAIGAPAAQAGHEDFGVRVALAVQGRAAQTQPTAVERILVQEQVRGADVCEGLTSCLADFRTATRAPNVVASSSGGIDWSDAGLGAGVTLGLVALTGAGALAVRRRRLLVTR